MRDDSHSSSSEDRSRTARIQHHSKRTNWHIADHDLSELCFRNVTKLNFLHRYRLPGGPVECTFETVKIVQTNASYTHDKPARMRPFQASHRVAIENENDTWISSVTGYRVDLHT